MQASILWTANLTGFDQNLTFTNDTSGGPHFLNSLGISDDGRTVAAATFDGSIWILDENGQVVWNRSPGNTTTEITTMSLSPDGECLAFSETGEFPPANPSKKITLVNRQGEELWNHSSRTFVFHSAVSLNGSCSVFGSYENITCIDRDGSILWDYPVPSPVISLDMSDDGGYIVAATDEGKALCLNRSGSVLWQHRFGSINDIKISGDGNYACISGSPFRTLYYLDNRGEFLWNRTVPRDGALFYDLSYDGYRVVIQVTGAVFCYDRAGEIRWHENPQFQQPPVSRYSPQPFSLSKDGSYLVTAERQYLVIRDDRGYGTGRIECDDQIKGAAISADGSSIAVITDNDLHFIRNPNSCIKFYGNISCGTEHLEEVLDECEPELSKLMGTKGGPLIGFGIDYKGYISLMWNEELEVNETMMDEIYSVIDETGKNAGIDNIPVGFLLSSGIKGD